MCTWFLLTDEMHTVGRRKGLSYWGDKVCLEHTILLPGTCYVAQAKLLELESLCSPNPV